MKPEDKIKLVELFGKFLKEFVNFSTDAEIDSLVDDFKVIV